MQLSSNNFYFLKEMFSEIMQVKMYMKYTCKIMQVIMYMKYICKMFITVCNLALIIFTS